MLADLVKANRSYRRFDEAVRIPYSELVELISLARLAPSGSNLQALKFYLVSEPGLCERVFGTLKFAAYLKDWEGPQPGERPSAYIVLLGDTRIKPQVDLDAGIAAQTIMLGAVERGYGGCMLASVNRPALSDILQLAAELQVVLVLALGKPAETCIIEDVSPAHGIQYYRDADDVHHVPKRTLQELIISTEN